MFYLLFLLSTFYFLFPVSTEAARLFFDAPGRELTKGEQLNVTLMLDSENQVLNAVEGVVKFPSEFLELKQLSEGDSLISLWVRRPEAETGAVVFSGIVPGGFRGLLSPSWSGYRPGPVLRLVLTAKKEGRARLEIRGGKALLHDGRGTPAPLTTTDLELTISVLGAMPQVSDAVVDRDPPEPFGPVVTRSPHIFDGKWFVAFTAEDRGSGIARFAVQENRRQKTEDGKWKTAESPYVLRDQKLASFIYVKAVDRSGNERLAVVPPRFPRAWYGNGWVWGIIIAVALVFFYVWRRAITKRKT